jgi:maleylacetoacetate isomerase
MPGVLLRHRWDCEASHSVRIALALKAIAYRTEEAPPPIPETATEGPRVRVLTPILEIEGDTVAHALSILEYLEETHADPPLLPGAARDRARVRAIAQSVATQFAPVVDPRVADHVTWLTGAGAEGRAQWMRRFIARALAAVEQMLDSPETGRFCHGDEPGLADCVLIPHIAIARRWGAPTVTFPRVTAIDLGCATHPAFVAAHPGVRGDPPPLAKTRRRME